MMHRNITRVLEKELETAEVIVITGMRRVGKTTMLNYLFDKIPSQNKLYIDLEDTIKRKLFEDPNYENVLNNLLELGLKESEKGYVLLDEIQFVREVPSVIKYLYDHYKIKFIVTGSSSFYLKNLFSESLAGRKLIFEIYPLAFDEFLKFKGVDKVFEQSFTAKAKQKNEFKEGLYKELYKEYVEYGGFPGVVLEPNFERKKRLLGEIFQSYFQKDIEILADFRDSSKLRDLILLLLPRVGNVVDISKLALGLSSSRESVYNYLEFLEATYFIKLLPKYTNIDKNVAGGKKLYVCDSGLANVLGKLSEGQLFENSVFQNLRSKHEINYYRKSEVNEVDFILDEKIALEVKTSASKHDIANLKKRLVSLKKLKEFYVVSLNLLNEGAVIMAWDL